MTFETNTISIKKYIFTHLKPTNFINNKRKSQSSVKNVKSKTKNRNLQTESEKLSTSNLISNGAAIALPFHV